MTTETQVERQHRQAIVALELHFERETQAAMRARPYAVACGEDDAVADRIEALERELAALEGVPA